MEKKNRLPQFQWLEAIGKNELHVVASEISHRTSHECTEGLIKAAASGLDTMVQLLIPLSHPKEDNSSAMQWAVRQGHAHCLTLLLPFSDPNCDEHRALWTAANFGFVECLKLLLPYSKCKTENSHALRQAARGGHLECVQALLPFVDLALLQEKAHAIDVTAQQGNLSIFQLLWTCYSKKEQHQIHKKLALDYAHPMIASWLRSQAEVENLEQLFPGSALKSSPKIRI